MNKNTEIMNNYEGAGVVKEEEAWTLKDAVRLYYGETKLSEEESKQVDEILISMDKNGLKEKCQKIALEREKKVWHIGRLCLNRVACIIFVACIFLTSTGFAVYMGYIRKIDVVDKGNHSEVDYTYYEGADAVKLSSIEDYYKPTWMPEGYEVVSEFKNELYYSIVFKKDKLGKITYDQSLPDVGVHFSTENGVSEKISFGRFSGEFIKTEKSNYIIVTDGIYLYDIIGDMDRESLINMMESLEKE